MLPRCEGGDLLDQDSPLTTSSPINTDAPPNHVPYNLQVKYLIYVPVMRVPLHVDNTANAYLAFKAAIKSG